MNKLTSLQALLELFAARFPVADIGTLSEAVYTRPLTEAEQQVTLQILDFARARQLRNPVYESAYRLLVHLYVLNGSRLGPLTRLDGRLRALAEGQGSFILISGMAGIGKTSLAMACQERAVQLGSAFITAICDEQERLPFGLWQDVVRSAALATNRPATPLPAPFGTGPAALSRHHLRQALASWIGACAALCPLVIFVDDLHWADVDSLDLLNELTHSMEQSPIVLMVAYSTEETQRGQALYGYLPRLQRARHVERLQLRLLTEDDTAQLIQGYHGVGSPELTRYLFQRAEGHPLFALELLQDLIEQGWLQPTAGGNFLPPEPSVPVPTALRQVILQRVEGLGKDAERLLNTAAVLGGTWRLEIIEHLLGWSNDRLLKALERAVRADIVRALDEHDNIFRFSHGLLQEALYQAQLPVRRKRVHAQIAAFLESSGTDLAGLAFHFQQAEHWNQASQWYRAAGDEARRDLAIHSALGLYQQALRAAQNARSTAPPAAILEIYEQIGDTHLILEQRREAELAYDNMREAARQHGDRAAEALALAHLAYVRVALYQLDLGEKTAREALALAEGSHQPRLLARAYTSLGRVQLVRGELDQAELSFAAAEQSSQAAGDLAMLSYNSRVRAYASVWQGRYGVAEQMANLALEQARATQDLMLISGGHQMLSYAQIEMGHYAAAQATLLAILDALDPALGTHHQLPRLLNQMGFLHLELGDAAGALEWDQRALAASRSTPGLSNFEMERYSLLNLATDSLELGQIDQARGYAAEFAAVKDLTEFSHFRYFNRYQLLLAEIQLRRGEHQPALLQARDARRLAASRNVNKNVAKSLLYEGQALQGLGQITEALQPLRQAVEIVDAIEHGSLRWKIRFHLALAYAQAGLPNSALLDEARARVATITQQLSGTELQRLFVQSPLVQALERELPSSAPPAAKRMVYPRGLTEREVDVLRLVAGGATNLQVAGALHISARTVNTHMTHILSKINCDNRTAATAFAIQHKLVKAD